MRIKNIKRKSLERGEAKKYANKRERRNYDFYTYKIERVDKEITDRLRKYKERKWNKQIMKGDKIVRIK